MTYIRNQNVDHMDNRIQVRDLCGPVEERKTHDDQALPKLFKIPCMLIKVGKQLRPGFKFKSNYHQLSVDVFASFYLPWISWDHLSFVSEPLAYITKMCFYKEVLIVYKK